MSNDEFNLLRKNYRFVAPQVDSEKEQKWEDRLIGNYHRSLYKEYALIQFANSSADDENLTTTDNSNQFPDSSRIAMRWRTENEVLCGKGVSTCANLQCNQSELLTSYEVPFRYQEEDICKKVLVKVRTCPTCSIRFRTRSTAS